MKQSKTENTIFIYFYLHDDCYRVVLLSPINITVSCTYLKYQLRPSLCIIVNVGDHHFTYYSNEWKSNVPLQLQ